MSILIRGMEMPKSLGITVTIFPDGRVIEHNGYGNYRVCGKAVPVPPHGRLVDADALKKADFPVLKHFDEIEDRWVFQPNLYGFPKMIDEAPTVIPAEEAHNGE